MRKRMIAIGNLIRGVIGFIAGVFTTKTGIFGGGNNWFLLIAIFLGYLIYREFNR